MQKAIEKYDKTRPDLDILITNKKNLERECFYECSINLKDKFELNEFHQILKRFKL